MSEDIKKIETSQEFDELESRAERAARIVESLRIAKGKQNDPAVYQQMFDERRRLLPQPVFDAEGNLTEGITDEQVNDAVHRVLNEELRLAEGLAEELDMYPAPIGPKKPAIDELPGN